MGKIARLPEGLANQIAAGEVVERPGSVVKELLENAIDADATRVRIDVEEGGTKLVSVCDDGEGMSPEDAGAALLRHATSKIAKLDDLLTLASYGFRGEALPSIASVSRLLMRTRRAEDDSGSELVVEGGRVSAVRPAACSKGTTVEVRELFYNVPARRKFLKSAIAESAHISEAVLVAALARPDLSFTLSRDGRVAKEFLRTASRTERTEQVLGSHLAHVRAERASYRLEAFLAPPERARAGATALYLFVNARPVKDRALARAVAQGYGSILEAGRYPVGAVYLELPSAEVDVNVHPQKAEVRFRDARAVWDFVAYRLQEGLAAAFGSKRDPEAPVRSFSRLPPQAAVVGMRAEPGSFQQPAMLRAEPLFSPPAGARSRGEFGSLRFLGQLRATFLLCEAEDALVILDQHAAAERVTFHRLKRQVATRAVAMQRLLVPEVVRTSEAEAALADERSEEAEAMGLEIRRSGPAEVVIHAVPRLLPRGAPERLFKDWLDEIAREAVRPYGERVDLVLATMACHGSIRAGDRLTETEARDLLEALDETDFAGHCPHGRPVVTRLSFAELERRVGR